MQAHTPNASVQVQLGGSTGSGTPEPSRWTLFGGVIRSVVGFLYLTVDKVLGMRLEIVLLRYVDDGCPDEYEKERPPDTKNAELSRVKMLSRFFGPIRLRRLSRPACYRYHEWRVPQILPAKRKKGGGRTVELDFNTLRNALGHAERVGLIARVPDFKWPTFCPENEVEHCRERMPRNIEELHASARQHFLRRAPSHVLGFLELFQGLTGLRSCEAVILRVDAGPEEPGYITPEGKLLRVRRSKRQQKVTPWVRITPEISEFLKALNRWRKRYYRDSPWFFPSPTDPNKHVNKQSLTRALSRDYSQQLADSPNNGESLAA